MKKTYLYMSILGMSVALAAGCQKADTAETTVTVETTAEQSTETESTSPAESETSDDAEILKNYHLLQGVIVKTDSEKGTFTVKTDDGAEYTLATENIHDVETEIADDSVVAIGYIGEELHDSDQLEDV